MLLREESIMAGDGPHKTMPLIVPFGCSLGIPAGVSVL